MPRLPKGWGFGAVQAGFAQSNKFADVKQTFRDLGSYVIFRTDSRVDITFSAPN